MRRVPAWLTRCLLFRFCVLLPLQGAGYLFVPFSFVLIEEAEEEAATAV